MRPARGVARGCCASWRSSVRCVPASLCTDPRGRTSSPRAGHARAGGRGQGHARAHARRAEPAARGARARGRAGAEEPEPARRDRPPAVPLVQRGPTGAGPLADQHAGGRAPRRRQLSSRPPAVRSRLDAPAPAALLRLVPRHDQAPGAVRPMPRHPLLQQALPKAPLDARTPQLVRARVMCGQASKHVCVRSRTTTLIACHPQRTHGQPRCGG